MVGLTAAWMVGMMVLLRRKWWWGVDTKEEKQDGGVRIHKEARWADKIIMMGLVVVGLISKRETRKGGG